MSFECFKNFLTILIYLISFFSFFLLNFFTDFKSEKFIEFTSINHTILNIILGILLFILLIHSIYRKIFLNFLNKNIKFLQKNNCKGILLLLIAIIYFAAENFNQLLLGMILMCCSLSIMIIEIAFDCRILNNNNNNNNNKNKLEVFGIKFSSVILTTFFSPKIFKLF